MPSFIVINIILFFVCDYCYGTSLPNDNCLSLVKDCGAKPNTNIDNTFAFISCQIKLAEKNGGCIIVPNGTYQVIYVPLNTSNIIYYMDPSVTFVSYRKNESYPLFFIGSMTRFVKNISMIGSSPSNKFVVDLRQSTNDPNGINLVGIDGFYLSNIDIKITPNMSNEKSALRFDQHQVNGTRYHPQNGTVTNITASDYIWGYGLMQMQSGENIHFENLDGTGGITLRLETGAGDQDGYVNNITANNIICRNGKATFYSCPHTQKNGFFNVSNLIGYSCQVTYSYGAGYSQDGKPPGYFANGSIVHSAMSYYGRTAQIDKTGIPGPSCGPCGAGLTKIPINYFVNITGLQSINYPPPSDRNSCPQWNPWDYNNDCYWDNGTSSRSI